MRQEENAVMPADLALALLINRTTAAYETAPPAYIVYRETAHIGAASLGRSEEIDRHVIVRNVDDMAVMNDLPRGAQRIGEAFPVVPYFDAFATFNFSYYAGLKGADIEIHRGTPFEFPIPAPQAGVDEFVPYMSFWDVRYAADSRPDSLHFTIDATPRLNTSLSEPYPTDVVEDPKTHLPSHIVLHFVGSDMVIALDYSVIDGHWIITHGTFTATQHVAFMTFVVNAEVTYDEFSFPSTPPPEAAVLPPPSPSPTPSP